MALDGVRDLTAIDVLADTGLIFLQQPGFKLTIPASGEQTPLHRQNWYAVFSSPLAGYLPFMGQKTALPQS